MKIVCQYYNECWAPVWLFYLRKKSSMRRKGFRVKGNSGSDFETLYSKKLLKNHAPNSGCHWNNASIDWFQRLHRSYISSYGSYISHSLNMQLDCDHQQILLLASTYLETFYNTIILRQSAGSIILQLPRQMNGWLLDKSVLLSPIAFRCLIIPQSTVLNGAIQRLRTMWKLPLRSPRWDSIVWITWWGCTLLYSPEKASSFVVVCSISKTEPAERYNLNR